MAASFYFTRSTTAPRCPILRALVSREGWDVTLPQRQIPPFRV